LDKTIKKKLASTKLLCRKFIRVVQMSPNSSRSVPYKGYPSVAAHLASSSELAVFRKFSNLNMRNLLYMQTELIMLEAELAELDREDASDNNRVVTLQSWEAILRSSSEKDIMRKEVALTMRKKLREYSRQNSLTYQNT
jgi:hypothetical protein